MKISIFSVYDSKTEIFSTPSFLLNKGTALRAILEAANDPSSSLSKYPADFTVFELGVFDDVEGTITMHPAKISLGTILEHKHPAEVPKQTNNGLGASL